MSKETAGIAGNRWKLLEPPVTAGQFWKLPTCWKFVDYMYINNIHECNMYVFQYVLIGWDEKHLF